MVKISLIILDLVDFLQFHRRWRCLFFCWLSVSIAAKVSFLANKFQPTCSSATCAPFGTFRHLSGSVSATVSLSCGPVAQFRLSRLRKLANSTRLQAFAQLLTFELSAQNKFNDKSIFARFFLSYLQMYCKCLNMNSHKILVVYDKQFTLWSEWSGRFRFQKRYFDERRNKSKDIPLMKNPKESADA